MGIIVFFIFVIIWIILIFKNYKKSGNAKKKDIKKALLLGLIPCAVICILSDSLLYLVLEILGNLILKFTNSSVFTKGTILFNLVNCFLVVALIEEKTKYLFAKKAVKDLSGLKRIDYVVLFGCVGLGYEILESLMFSLKGNDILLGICRGVFVPHLMFQMYMGYYYYDVINSDKAKEKRLFLVPYLIHGTNDFLLEVSEILLMNDVNSLKTTIGVIIFIVVVILNVVTTSKCYRLFRKCCKDEG